MAGIAADNRKIARNTAFMYVRLFCVLAISLYISRAILGILGVSDFGIYNVVSGFASVFGILNATLSSSLSRFYNYEGARRGDAGIMSVYSAGIIIHIVLAVLVVLLLESLGLWYINSKLIVPPDRITQVNALYQFAIISLAFLILQTPFSSAVLSQERMDFYAMVSIIDILLKLCAVLVLPHIPGEKLGTYGFLLMVVSLIDFLFYSIFAKKKINGLKMTWKPERALFGSMLSFSGWNMVGSLMYMLKGQGVNILLNRFFGTVVNAARGLAFQVMGAVSGFAGTVSTSFNPQIVDSYSKGDEERAVKLFLSESKLCYCLICMMVVPLSVEIDYLLSLWLGETVPENTALFTILVLVDVLICSLNTPVTQLTSATGKIRRYQIISSCLNILLLPVCWIVLKAGFQAWTVFVITIVFSILNQIVCTYCMTEVISLNVRRYLRSVIFPIFIYSLLLPVAPLLLKHYLPSSFLRIVIVTAVDIVLAFVLTVFIVLDADERTRFREYIENRLFRRLQ